MRNILWTAQEMRTFADEFSADARAAAPEGTEVPNPDWIKEEETVAAMLRQGADLLEADAPIERVIRDAVVNYNEMFPYAKNDDCERELRKRAGLANAWLTAHGFAPEPFHYDAEQPYIKLPRKEEKDDQDDGCRGD